MGDGAHSDGKRNSNGNQATMDRICVQHTLHTMQIMHYQKYTIFGQRRETFALPSLLHPCKINRGTLHFEHFTFINEPSFESLLKCICNDKLCVCLHEYVEKW